MALGRSDYGCEMPELFCDAAGCCERRVMKWNPQIESYE